MIDSLPNLIEDCLDLWPPSADNLRTEMTSAFAGERTLCMQLHPNGLFLAAATSTGSVVIWDLDTRCTKHILRPQQSLNKAGNGMSFNESKNNSKGNSFANCCVSWLDANSERVFATFNNTLIFWDAKSEELVHSVTLSGNVKSLCLSRSGQWVLLGMSQPALLNISTFDITPLEIPDLPAADYSSAWIEWDDISAIALADNRGFIHILHREENGDYKFLHSSKVLNTPLRSLKSVPNTEFCLLLAQDRSIRLFHLSASTEKKSKHYLAPVLGSQKFIDPVSKCQWANFVYDNEQEVIIAGVLSPDIHRLYIWNVSNGHCIKQLEGPREGLVDLTYLSSIPKDINVENGNKNIFDQGCPFLVTLSYSGLIYIWTHKFHDNWAAFAPDFTELQQNVYYHEREDEFDDNDNGESLAIFRDEIPDEDIDIWTQ